ncbi:MAG: hypothetical protein R3E82_21135 [Pseudomonadales bacterium]
MHLPVLPRLIYSLVALWAIALGLLFVMDLNDPRQMPWSADILLLVEDEVFRELLSIFTRFTGGLLLGIGLVLWMIILLPKLHSPERANVIAMVLCLSVLLPQIFTWIQLGLPSLRIALLGAGVVLVVVAFVVGRTRAGKQQDDVPP